MKPQIRVQLVNEMAGLTFECSAAELASGACVAATGDQILETFAIPAGNTGRWSRLSRPTATIADGRTTCAQGAIWPS